MSDERLKRFALKLRDEVSALAGRVSHVEKVRAVARDGRDGAHGAPGEPGEKGEPGKTGDRGVQGLPGRDGRDGLPGPKGDSITRAEVEPGNMLSVWIGGVKTLAGRIVAQRGEKGERGAPGQPGPKGEKGDPGKDGKDGTSVTKVELKGRELFVWLDGVKKKAGQIAFPSLGAGGGGVRRLPPDNCRVGFIDYNDAATATTPINLTADVWTDIPNDGAGPYTNKQYPPEGITDVWDVASQRFDWSQLRAGDMVDLRVDLDLILAQANAHVEVRIVMAEGDPGEYIVQMAHTSIKDAGQEDLPIYQGLYMGNTETLNNPAKLQIKSDVAATLTVRGWYCKLIMRG